MSFVCNKALKLGTTPYYPGDIIPDDAVIPGRVRALKTSGYISELLEIPDNVPVATGVLEASGFDGKVIAPVIRKIDGDTAEAMAVPLSEGGMQEVFAIMQMNVEEATKAIEEVTEENVLIVLHAADSRNGVKKAAEKRHASLSSIEGDSNESTGGNAIKEDVPEVAHTPDK